MLYHTFTTRNILSGVVMLQESTVSFIFIYYTQYSYSFTARNIHIHLLHAIFIFIYYAQYSYSYTTRNIHIHVPLVQYSMCTLLHIYYTQYFERCGNVAGEHSVQAVVADETQEHLLLGTYTQVGLFCHTGRSLLPHRQVSFATQVGLFAT